MKRSQVCFAASSGLVDHRVKLGLDLIQASGEVNLQDI
jgi:hypothetical protein